MLTCNKTSVITAAAGEHPSNSFVCTTKGDKSSLRKNPRKKHNRSSSLLQAVSSALSSGNRGRRIASLSTPEEASSRGSSRTRKPRVRRQPSMTSRPAHTKVTDTRSPFPENCVRNPISPSRHGFAGPNVPTAGPRAWTAGQRSFELYQTPTKSTAVASKSSSKDTSSPRKPCRPDSVVPNFSYKSSPLLPPTTVSRNSQVQDTYGIKYQSPMFQNEASEIENNNDNTIVGASSSDRCDEAPSVEMAHFEKLRAPSDSTEKHGRFSSSYRTAPADGKPTSNLTANKKTNPREHSDSSHVSKGEPGRNSLGIFSNAHSFGDCSYQHISGNCSRFANHDIGSRHNSDGLGLNNRTPSHGSGIELSNEGVGIFGQAPNFSDAFRFDSPEIPAANDIPLPNLDKTQQNSGHCGSPDKKYTTTRSHNYSSDNNVSGFDVFRTMPHHESSTAAAPTGNAFCS